MVGQQVLHRVDIAPNDVEHVGGRGEQRVVRAAAEHIAGEIDERRFDAHPVQMDADAERAARSRRISDGLAALASVRPANDQLASAKRTAMMLPTAVPVMFARRVRSVSRRAAGTAQRLQQQALVITAHAGRAFPG